MVIMASGIARGRVRTTAATTTTVSRNMAALTELKNDCACHQFARENWGWQGENIATYK